MDRGQGRTSRASAERDRAIRGGSRRTPGPERGAWSAHVTSEDRTYASRRPERDGRSRRWLATCAQVAAALLAACNADEVEGRYDAVPLEADLTLGVSRPVQIVRDKYGIAHIDARTLADAAFAQGYVMAHDRLPQMDVLRRFGAGTLAELFGALDPSVIDTDLEMRMHRMRPLAEATWAALQASPREDDQQLVILLQRYSDGVNAYAHAIRTDANPSGPWDLDPNVAVSFDASRFVDWHPIDSLVLGRFQAFAQSWSTPHELDLTALYQGLRDTFPTGPRAGLANDLMVFTPVGAEPTIPGFPNVDLDSGTSSDGSPRTTMRPLPGATTTVPRPRVARDVLANARAFFARTIHTGPFGALGPHAFMRPYAGSNNWTGGNVLATDQHLQLSNPSIFYPTHLMVRDLTDQGADEDAVDEVADLDVIGVTFPGLPGVVLGSNGFLAWSATVAAHDVNDVYLETIVPCGVGGAMCVQHDGASVPLETFTETIGVGALGALDPSKQRTATYEVVPHHGPIIPTLDRTTHQIVPRTGAEALSVAYTGYTPSVELRAIWNLAKATTLEDAFVALGDITYGAQNWMMIDRFGSHAWTTHAVVPLRSPAAYAWNASTNPAGAAPFFVLPGDGSAEWLRDASGVVSMSPRYIPHAFGRAYLVSANADPVGATFDGDPLNGPAVDGRPLYAGASYADGLRAERIGELLRAAPVLDAEAMAAMQHDTRSTLGAKLTPYLRAALALVEAPPAAPADVAPYVAALSPGDRARLDVARTLLGEWTFATPTGLAEGDVMADSAATAVFNAWVHYFVERVLADELAQLPGGFDVWRLDTDTIARIVWALISAPEAMSAGSAGEPIVCDALATPGDEESCTRVVLQAMLDAMTYLESPAGFGTADAARWAWGDKHRLVIRPLVPNTALDLPGTGLPGFPRRGDTSVVNRADAGWNDLDFSRSADGPAQRFIAIAPGFASDASRIRVRWALPGGVIFDSRSPHYRDLLDTYYLPEQHFDAPYLTDELIRDGESRWVFR